MASCTVPGYTGLCCAAISWWLAQPPVRRAGAAALHPTALHVRLVARSAASEEVAEGPEQAAEGGGGEGGGEARPVHDGGGGDHPGRGGHRPHPHEADARPHGPGGGPEEGHQQRLRHQRHPRRDHPPVAPHPGDGVHPGKGARLGCLAAGEEGLVQRRQPRLRPQQPLEHLVLPHDRLLRVLLAAEEADKLPVQVPKGGHVQHQLKVTVVHMYRAEGAAVEAGKAALHLEHAHGLRPDGVVEAESVLPGGGDVGAGPSVLGGVPLGGAVARLRQRQERDPVRCVAHLERLQGGGAVAHDGREWQEREVHHVEGVAPLPHDARFFAVQQPQDSH
mmetsp:Transcript_11705/g.24511  ORF Transcript_11705/g.24511 Transcript_11705/m.24511 type:complete len:334 (-) Transcript_11705:796-1797(-)